MALIFNSTAPGTNANYYKYLDSSINGKMAKTDRIAEPTLLDFCLIPYDGSFVKLRRGNYITVDTVTFPKWFTGYITNDPELTYLGTNGTSHTPVWGYKYQATSDDYILNLSPLGLMPPFTNTTMGAILTALVAQLAPGKFDVTGLTAGQTIARYVVDPSKTFSDVVKEFTELSAYRFWANDFKLFFQQQDTTPSPMIIDGADKHFSPDRLTLTPSPEPIVNDAVVVGSIEPQGYMNEYFIGDGFTARFPLLSSIYGIDRSILLDDSFGSAIDTTKWAEFDTVNDWIQLANGYINAVGGTNDGVLGVYLTSANLLPLEGAMRLTHGEYDFVSASSGVIAALWTGSPRKVTNTLLQSETMDNASWGKQAGGTGVAPVVTANYGLSPRGDFTAERVQFDKGAGTTLSDLSFLNSNFFTSVNAQVYSTSIWLKSNKTTNQVVQLSFNGNGGGLVTVTPTWQRFSISNVGDGTLKDLRLGLRGTTGSDVTADILVWAAQITLTSTVQPYVVTTTASATAYGGCIYGIECSKSGANTILKPIVGGVVDGSQSVTVDYTKRYVMRTIVNFSQVTRMQNVYSGVDSTGTVQRFGGHLDLDQANYNTVITEINPTTGVQTNQWSWNNRNKPLAFYETYAYYVPIALDDLHCSFTNVTISTPMLANLEIKAFGVGVYLPKLIGVNDIDAFDGQTPVATITDANSGATTRSSTLGTPQYNPGNAALQFFKDSTKQTATTPGVGDFLHLSYRRAGAAMARVTNFTSVAAEQALWGDSGLRSLTKLDLNPLPRTAAEAEAAAAALVTDGGFQHYEGTYEQWYNLGVTGQPMSGQILKFQNLAASMPSITAEEIHEVVTTFESSSGGTERFYFQVTFGRPDRLRQLLSTFGQQTDVFAPQDTAEIPDATSLPSVGLTFSDDVLLPTLVSVGSTQLNFDSGQAAPVGGGFEIRYTDDQWGADDGKNLILRTSGTSFAVPRTQRGKICFIKAYDARNKLKFSEDLTNAAWIKGTSSSITRASGTNPDGDISVIDTITYSDNTVNANVRQDTGLAAANMVAVATTSVKGTAGQQVQFQLRSNSGSDILATTVVTFTGVWQRVSVSGTYPSGALGNATLYFRASTANSFAVTRSSWELNTTFETAYVKTLSTIFGAYSRYAAGMRVAFPLVPPVIASATFDYTDVLHPVMTINLPTVQQDIWGVEIRASDQTTVLKKTDLIDAAYVPTWTYDNSSIKTRSLDFYVYTYNLLGEYSTGTHVTTTIPTPTMTGLSMNDSTKYLSWTATSAAAYFVEVDKVSNAFANTSFQGFVTATAALCSDSEFFPQRWFRVTAYDPIGSGTNSVISHVYTPTSVVTFGSGEVQSIASPASPTTDPTVPSPYAGYASDYVEASWKDYSINSGRSS
jgi:hypothetical protein